MNLTPIKANMTEIKLSGGLRVLFSYKTPVACVWTNGTKEVFYKTSKFWSRTTSQHIKQWIVIADGWLDRTVEEKPQEYFDNLINEVK